MKKLLFFAVGAFFMLFTACNTESVSLEGSWIIETAYGQPVIVADTAMITFDTKEMRVAVTAAIVFSDLIPSQKGSLSH